MLAGLAGNERFQRLWPWIPLLLAVVWLGALAADLRAIVQAIYANADFVSAPVIGELYDERAPGTQVVLGNFPWYETLWFERLTAGLPAHRQVWQLAPWLFSLAGVAAVAWATWRAAGAWAAMVVAVALGCAGPALLTFQFGGSLHAPTFAHACLLGAFLVLCASRGGRAGSWPVHVAACAALAAVTAAGVASDDLLLAAGIAPFALAAIGMVWLLPRPAGPRIAVSALAVSALAVAGGRLLAKAMEDENVIASAFDVTFATWDKLFANARVLAHSLAYLFNGDFGGEAIDLWSVLSLVCAVAVVGAVAFAVGYGRRWAARAVAAPATDEREAARRAHLAFWFLAGAVLGLTFLLTSVPVDKYSARYVLTVGYAVAIVVAVAAVDRPWLRIGVVTGLTLVLVSGVSGLVRGTLQDSARSSPGGNLSGPLERLARAEGVEHGYAGYWTAAPLTWQTRARLQVYPVKSCTGTPTLCPYPFHRIASWYDPRPGERSILVVDPFQPSAGAPTGPDPAFGAPQRVARIADRTVYVYGYDIASRFGR